MNPLLKIIIQVTPLVESNNLTEAATFIPFHTKYDLQVQGFDL